MNIDELYEQTEEEAKQEAQKSLLIPENFKKHLESNNLTDDQVANLLAIHLGRQHQWDTAAVNELTQTYIKHKVQQGLISTNIANKEQKDFKDSLIKQANILAPVPTGIEETPNGYILWRPTKDGRAIPVKLTNFIFMNIRTVYIEEEKVLLVDVKCETEPIEEKIMLKADECVERKKLLTVIRRRIPAANITTTKTEEVDELMTYVAKQAKGIAHVVDYTGMFYHNETGQYYFVANDGSGGHTYIKPSTLNVPDSDLVQIKGRRHKSSQVTVRNVLSDASWHSTATELLSLVPGSLNNSKSLLMLSWFFAALISPWMFEQHNLKLPILFIYGEPGSGKSTNLNLITTFFGNPNNTDISMSSTNQPIRDAMSSTNVFQMLTTEYNDKAPNITAIINMLKILFDRSFYERGQLDRNESYRLQAPWIMQGNMRVNNQAVQDRMLQILVQKSDRNLDGRIINRALILKHENKKFIEGYLPYLLDRQDQWKTWYEQALIYVPEDIDARQLDITTTLVIGLMMIQDLRKSMGMAQYKPHEIKQVVDQITQSRAQNQIQPQHIQFLEYLQTYHTDPQIYSKRVNGVSETHGFMFNQAWWLNKYQDFCKGKGNDFDKNVILDGLRNLGVTTNQTISVRGNNAKCLAFNAQELEKATQGVIEAGAWVENPLELIVDYDPEAKPEADQPRISIN